MTAFNNAWKILKHRPSAEEWDNYNNRVKDLEQKYTPENFPESGLGDPKEFTANDGMQPYQNRMRGGPNPCPFCNGTGIQNLPPHRPPAPNASQPPSA